MKIVFISDTYLGSPFVVGSRQLSLALSKLGHETAHISSPLNPAAIAFKRHEPAVQQRMELWRKGISRQSSSSPWNWVPFSPLPWQIPFVYRLFDWNPFGLANAGILKRLQSVGMHEPDLLLIDEPRMVGIEKTLKPRLCIYRPADRALYRTGDSRVVRAERSLLERCQGVIATSSVIIDDLSPLALPHLVLRNGVDHAHFSPIAGKSGISTDRPRCVYVGALDSRFGWQILSDAARRRPGYDFLLGGPVLCHVPDLPNNVRLLGTVDYKDVPALLHTCHVGMIPLSKHPLNEGRSPMKFYEYLAAGLPVVATSTLELRRRNQEGVLLTEDADGFASALDAQITAKQESRMDWSALARPWSWDSRAEELLKFVMDLKGS
ncbi:MAG: hypothetical protein RL173_162 [Fibrobacterota bacterium]|jgi:glycosyltransferase involved in cell wall biosynthesis